MTPDEINLVQTSLRRITPVADLAAALFFARLFEIDPPLRGLIASDFRDQQQRLMKIISFIAFGLDNPEGMGAVVRQLTSQATRSPLQDHHYQSIATALLWTLDQILGPAFTPETRTAWIKTYGLFSIALKTGRATAPSAGQLA